MRYWTLFDRRRRNDMQDALEKGDLGTIAKRLKPEAESPGKILEEMKLSLGMARTTGDSTIRFMGIERGEAVVMIQAPDGSRTMHVKNGQRMPVKIEGTEVNGKANVLFLISGERDGPSGQPVLTVRFEVEGGKP